MSSSELRDAAAAFRRARETREPIQAPSETIQDLTLNQAWEIQRLTVEMATSGGDRLVGYKLGNIAKVMQAAFGLDHPDYGFLLASSFHHEGQPLSRAQFIKPYVELEPAFILRGGLKGPNCTAADVIRAVDYVVPAIEIIDSRVKDWTITLEDTVADCGSNGAVIIGGSPRKPTDLDLGNTRGVLCFNGREITTGNTRNILGNPYAAVAWLVNRLHAWDVGFEAGQIILPGSCLEAMPMTEAGRWSCSFEGWGTIEFDVE